MADWISLTAAAKLLRTTPDKLAELMVDHELSHVVLGQRVMVRRSDLERLLTDKEHRHEADS